MLTRIEGALENVNNLFIVILQENTITIDNGVAKLCLSQKQLVWHSGTT